MKEELEIQYWPLQKLIPYARNPRVNDDAVPKIASAIKEFGFKVPIIVRSDGEVVDGHLRIKAANLLKLPKVPVVLADDLTEQQVKAFRLSVNRMAELAEWDEKLLSLELEEINDELLPALGWSIDEVEDLISLEHEDFAVEMPDLDSVSEAADKMQEGSRKSIMIDFKLEDYEEALKLISSAKKQGVYIGLIFVEALKNEIG
ncbi:MAG: ParB N-terminal domain-containing protein [Oscillatoria sp. SIO1A7]|nr:ParB N-terminal domain-containing protein [Oscillatoria sp. SIO1A7]